MSLETLNQKITAIRGQAAQAQQSYTAQIDGLSADEQYSNAAKSTMVGELRESTTAKLQELQAQETAAIATERKALVQRITGTASADPAAVISFRDAQDRAAAIDDPNVATQLMQRALDVDDSVLATAILARSVEMGFTSAINDYVADHPSTADAIRDLEQLERSRNDIGTQLSDYAAYVTPSRTFKPRVEGNFANGRVW